MKLFISLISGAKIVKQKIQIRHADIWRSGPLSEEKGCPAAGAKGASETDLSAAGGEGRAVENRAAPCPNLFSNSSLD